MDKIGKLLGVLLIFLMLSASPAAMAKVVTSGIAVGDAVTAAYFSLDPWKHSDLRLPQTVQEEPVLFSGIGHLFDLTISSSQIVASNFTVDGYVAPPLFSGFVVSDLSHPFATPYSLGAGTNLAGLGMQNIALVGPWLAVNWQGLVLNRDTRVVINLSPVPEPAISLMLLTGLAAIAVTASRRNNSGTGH